MIYIARPETDPYFNIAAEEFFFNSVQENCFMLWRNRESVICGKHQAALAEVNYKFLRENEIPLLRRVSGGGTVYHDPGNINFTFITHVTSGDLVDFKRYIIPVLETLSAFSDGFTLDSNNNIRLNGLKVSGNSEHIRKNRVLHHGTLLFSTRLDRLNKVLDNHPERYSGKWIHSRKTRVTNISDHPGFSNDLEAFMMALQSSLMKKLYCSTIINPDPAEKEKIERLAQEKYKSREWNTAYSPSYTFSNDIWLIDELIRIEFTVKQGIIADVNISSNHPVNTILSGALTGSHHEENEIFDRMVSSGSNQYFTEFSKALVLDLFF